MISFNKCAILNSIFCWRMRLNFLNGYRIICNQFSTLQDVKNDNYMKLLL